MDQAAAVDESSTAASEQFNRDIHLLVTFPFACRKSLGQLIAFTEERKKAGYFEEMTG